MVGNANQAADPCGAVEDELPGFLGRPGNLTLEHRIDKADGESQVVEEVRDPCSNGTRYNEDVSVRYGTQNVSIKSVVKTEDGPVEALQGIIHLLLEDI